MTGLRIHHTLQQSHDEAQRAAAARPDFTGLAYRDCNRGLVVEPQAADWNTLYFKAILATNNVAQWDKVHIYVHGTQRGWLSGQSIRGQCNDVFSE